MAFKANIHAKTTNGASPMHYAAMGGHIECIKLLIHAGASQEVNATDCFGETPLARAIHSNKPDCVELLLDAGAKVSNVRKDINLPDWMKDIVKKRGNVKRSLVTLIGVLRKRFTISFVGLELIGNHLPRDIVNLVSICVWNTRYDSRWIGCPRDKEIEVIEQKIGWHHVNEELAEAWFC